MALFLSPSNQQKLVNVKETKRETVLCLAAAHALVQLDDGTVVGDPMEKAALEALGWHLAKGDKVLPNPPTAETSNGSAQSSMSAQGPEITIRRRFAFSSALKRMSTVSSMKGGRGLAAVKGAPETIKTMLSTVPQGYDETYKSFTRKGSRVLALGMREMDSISNEKV